MYLTTIRMKKRKYFAMLSAIWKKNYQNLFELQDFKTLLMLQNAAVNERTWQDAWILWPGDTANDVNLHRHHLDLTQPLQKKRLQTLIRNRKIPKEHRGYLSSVPNNFFFLLTRELYLIVYPTEMQIVPIGTHWMVFFVNYPFVMPLSNSIFKWLLPQTLMILEI